MSWGSEQWNQASWRLDSFNSFTAKMSSCSSCCYLFLRLLVSITGLLLLCIGLLLTGVVGWFLFSDLFYLGTSLNDLPAYFCLLFTIGLLLLLLSCFSSCGALLPSSCLLGLFSTLLLSLIVVQLVGCGLLLTNVGWGDYTTWIKWCAWGNMK